MRELVLDKNGKVPRFVVFKDAVVNQREGGELAYQVDWKPAFIYLHRKWKRERVNE